MKPIQPQEKDKPTSELDRRKYELRLAKGVAAVGQSVLHRDPEAAIIKAIGLGAKLASSPFYDENVNVLKLLEELKKMGPEVLLKTPETLFAYIDRTYGNKTEAQSKADILYYHENEILRTDVPILVRNKIYAIRVASMSDAPYEEWNTFEKVGGAFNGRVANFSHVEPLSAAECAVTVALLDQIRPDRFSNEVKIYIANCCHHDGLLTVDPVNELAIAEQYLQQFNEEASGKPDLLLVAEIKNQYEKLKAGHLEGDHESPAYVQASKLLGAHLMAEEAIRGNH